MEWVRAEDALVAELEAEDPRKHGQWDAQQALLGHPAKPEVSGGRTMVSGLALAPVFLLGACLAGVHHHPAANIVGVMLMITSVALLSRVSPKPATPRFAIPLAPPKMTSLFTIRVTPSALTVAADGILVRHIALADIADVVVAERLEIVQQDGSRTDLPVTHPSFVNEAVAGELRTNVREMRAQTSDYRGGSLRD